MPMSRAGADQLPGGSAAGGLAPGFCASTFICGLARQAVHAFARLDRGRGQPGEGFQAGEIDVAEARGVQRVQAQQAPGAVIDGQRAAQAVMDLQTPPGPFDEAIIGVGQLAIGGKPGGTPAGQDLRQTRMLAHPEAAAKGVRTQPQHRDGHQ